MYPPYNVTCASSSDYNVCKMDLCFPSNDFMYYVNWRIKKDSCIILDRLKSRQGN